MGSHAHDPVSYLLASSCAAVVNYPLWKASAIAQSGFKAAPDAPSPPSSVGRLGRYLAPLRPPYKGMVPVITGMAWARAAIFYGSDRGKAALRASGVGDVVATIAPPLVVSSCVQVVNMPLVRASVMIQDPACPHRGVLAAGRALLAAKGVGALWHGTSAGVFKTVPKYCTAVVVKDALEERLPRVRPGAPRARRDALLRSALKACAAALAGAVLTNPLDVVRNEMFKTDLPLVATVRHLHAKHAGPSWLVRGIGKNVVAVAVPVACTIFLTDAFERWRATEAADGGGDD